MEEETKFFSKALDSKPIIKFMGQDDQWISKNAELSESFRNKGNELYQKKRHKKNVHSEIWFYYCKSIATAAKGSDKLALAYDDRSVFLMHIGLYKSSIADIDRLLYITKDNLYRIQLLLRKIKCSIALGLPGPTCILEIAQFLLDQVHDQHLKESFQKDIKSIKLLLSNPPKAALLPIQDERAEEHNRSIKDYIINDFSAVTINYNDKYGRYLFATKDFQPGEIIFIEKPYIRCTDSLYCHIYCSHCFAMTWTAIPCDDCSWIMFCSDDCKKKAWDEYHDIECKVYSFSKEIANDSHKRLVLRAFILGLKEFGSIENLKNELEEFDKNTDIKRGFMKDGKLQPSSFKTIYSLSKDMSNKALNKQTYNTAMILKALAINSFFGDNFDWSKTDTYKTNENAMFVGRLLLCLGRIIQVNGDLMRNSFQKFRNKINNKPCTKIECAIFGSYLAPVSSLFNHSCDPNAIRCYSQAHNVIMYALKPIKKGEQIFHCYVKPYCEETFTDRQTELSKIFTFKCDCQACEKKFLDSCKYDVTPFHSMEKELSLELSNVTIPASQSGSNYSVTRAQVNVPDGILNLREAMKAWIEHYHSAPIHLHLRDVLNRFYGLKFDVPKDCTSL